jgi:predicted nucleotidyltransferase
MAVHDKKEIIKLLDDSIKNYRQIELCFLYGSAALDRLNAQSDIDVAVASSTPLSVDDRLELSLILSQKAGREVSVLDLKKLNGLILREILTKGITIKNTNPMLKTEFLIRMLDFIEDMLPLQLEFLLKKARDFAYGT